MSAVVASDPMIDRRSLVTRLGGAAMVGALSAPVTSVDQASARPADEVRAIASGEALPQDSPTVLTLAQGRHSIARSTTINSGVVLMPGASIDVAPGQTLTILGDFSAPVAPVFTGSGQVNLNASRCHAAFPEWWGAVADDPAVDCLPALQASIAAHPFIILRAADYHISGTFRINRPYLRIWGAGYRGTRPGEGTRLILRSGAADVVHVGPRSRPSQVNDFLEGVDLRWLDLTRSMPIDASLDRQPAGLRAQFVLFCQFEAVSSSQNGVGFVAKGVVRSAFRDCIAFRSFDGAGAGAPFRGFLLDGDDSIGLAGGNASLFLTDCNVSVGGAPNIADPVGLLLSGGFADTYVTNFETTHVATGIRVAGKTADLGAQSIVAHANLHIRMPIIDQCSAIGIDIADTSEHALIELSQPYVALAPRATAGIRVDRMRGALSILGGQVLGRIDAAAKGNGVGLLVHDSNGLSVTGLKLLDLRQPIRLEQCQQASVQAWVGNPSQLALDAAVRLQGCVQSRLAVQIGGRTGAFQRGIHIIDANSTDLRIDAMGIDLGALAGGAAARVVLGGRSMAVPGRSAGILVE